MELFAKSPRGDQQLTLCQHTLDVMDAASFLFGKHNGETRLGKRWLEFFRLPDDNFPVFYQTLQSSAAFHDLGKANEPMQLLFLSRGKQAIRHEHLSGLFLAQPGMENWLKSSAYPVDFDIVISAVISHHLKVKPEVFAEPLRADTTFRVMTDCDDFDDLLQLISARLGLSGDPPSFSQNCWWGYPDPEDEYDKDVFNITSLREEIVKHRLRPFKRNLRPESNRTRSRLLWAVRSALIAADAAASGLRREGQSLKQWINHAFCENSICTSTYINESVIGPRVNQLEEMGRWKSWNDFQVDCSDQEKVPARALLIAPCGSGKTLAAWRWIASQLESKPVGRVIFLYPTRATAKEGFRDYVSWAPECDAGLMHNSSAYDLEGMFANEPTDPRAERNYEANRRLFSLGNWPRRVFSATVDQFLAFLAYGYGPMCMLPILADSVLVIDEVHSFDRSMFSALKDFLTTFNLPTLCMTATLREQQRSELESECQLKIYKDKPGELLQIAQAPRYKIHSIDENDVLDVVEQAIGKKRRVLWVVNQVRCAQQIYLQCCQRLVDAEVVCYHSRYRLCDRRDRHDEVVQAIQSHMPPALAITTQVCEMSLDLDCDVLITEKCPITSLIQRMGRCNRNRLARENAGDVYVYQPISDDGTPNLLPYDDDSLKGLDEFLGTLSNDERINQVDLEDALEKALQPSVRLDEQSSFLRSGPYAMGSEESFRDIEQFTRPAILKRDRKTFIRLHNQSLSTDGLVVPVPNRLAQPSTLPLPSYLSIADDQFYNAQFGFCDDIGMIEQLKELG